MDLKPEEVVSDWYPFEITPKQDGSIISGRVEKRDFSYYEALEKIEQAIKEEVEELDLSGMELTELPPEFIALSLKLWKQNYYFNLSTFIFLTGKFDLSF